jgi:L-seryl-tRNA(Ser) seleniumtransferase
VPDFRVIPSIDELRRRPAVIALEAQFGSAAAIDALRTAAGELRRSIAAAARAPLSEEEAAAQIESLAASSLTAHFGYSLRPVINATGVVLHTNLGRAPLAAAALDRIREVARGYSSLEYDVERGARGRRDLHAEALLRRLTGAEAAVVVNNNAAATLLILAALASGREVIVSRGELVEIGGGFRVPEIMAQSGAVLREVGTTNKTRAGDYAAAVTDRTALILRVHPSNFRVLGFTERPMLREVIEVGRRLNVAVAEDLGSGLLAGPERHRLDDEPSVEETIAAGVDVCCFSGDKLLGGPQAGIIAGRLASIDRIRRHPLMRALRVDKMTYAALEATLLEYAAGRADRTVPARRMLAMSADDIRARAERLAAELNALPRWRAELLEGRSAVGGGSAPGSELPTVLVSIDRPGESADAVATRIRQARPPIIARIEDGRVLLDLRTVAEAEDSVLAAALAAL